VRGVWNEFKEGDKDMRTQTTTTGVYEDAAPTRAPEMDRIRAGSKKLFLFALVLLTGVAGWQVVSAAQSIAASAKSAVAQADAVVAAAEATAKRAVIAANQARELASMAELSAELADNKTAEANARAAKLAAELVASKAVVVDLSAQVRQTEMRQARKRLQPYLKTLADMPAESRQRLAEKLLAQIVENPQRW